VQTRPLVLVKTSSRVNVPVESSYPCLSPRETERSAALHFPGWVFVGWLDWGMGMAAPAFCDAAVGATEEGWVRGAVSDWLPQAVSAAVSAMQPRILRIRADRPSNTLPPGTSTAQSVRGPSR
jgi:hypothetical protein